MIKRILLIAALAFSLTAGACVEQEGPAEELGENIDEAAEEVREGVEETCEELADEVAADDPNCG